VAELLVEGGCLCGRLRFGSAEAPVDAGYCHCRICQRSTGAPVLAWAAFPKGAFRYAEGEPAIYRSSENAQREFCQRCGTQIAFRDDGSPHVDVNIASLDAPESVAPRWHIWTGSRIPWFDCADDLPRYEDEGPTTA